MAANAAQLRLLEEQSFKFVIKSKERHNSQQYQLAASDVGPLFTATRWQVDCLEEYRTRLNECKAQVGKFPLYEWERHTEINEISSNIKKVILQRFKNKPPVITRAWIKFYDIMASFPLFGSTDDCTIRTLFLCEAPGAFVNAMNHFIRTNFSNIGFEWLATTLNPYYEQIDFDAFVLDDRFIQDSHLFHNWFFASTNTGDLLDSNFANDLKTHLNSTYKSDNYEMFDCVTGDGAFNCLNAPERQEEMVFKLIFKEVMVATQFLKNNGSMVIKFFTFFSCETISLLYFICNCFHEVICYKPVASKHGNSEIYLVGLKFDRNIYNSLSSTVAKLDALQFVLNRDSIPQEFIDQICELCKEISSRQIGAINLNVKLFGQTSSEQLKDIIRSKNAIGEAFLKKFNMFSIPVSDQLIFNDHHRKGLFSKKFINLFDEYQFNNSKEMFCKNLKRIVSPIVIDSTPNLVSTQIRTEIKPQFVTGTPYSHINNCRFCDLYILRAFILSNSYLKFSSTLPVSGSIFDGLKDILSCQLENSIYFYKKTPFSQYIDNECNRLYARGVEYHELDSIKEEGVSDPVIHFLDLYDLTQTITSNDFDMCLYLKNTFSTLVTNKHLQNGHIVVVRYKILISRLSASLLYIISRAFRKLAMFFYVTPTDSISPGVFAVLSNYRQLPSQYEFIFDERSHKESWNKRLLEFIPVPTIVSDHSYFEALFQVNSSSILLSLKHQLSNCSESLCEEAQ